jgi:NAD(P)H-nitrite reductase large subunit
MDPKNAIPAMGKITALGKLTGGQRIDMLGVKVKMATAGCPRNCSEAMVKDVGGAAGSHVRKGDVLCVVDSHEEVIKYAARFVQYYREVPGAHVRFRRAARDREDPLRNR